MAPSADDLLSQNEFWVLLFILGWAMFNWPLFTLTAGKTLFNVPLVLIHIAAVWLIIILLLFLFERANNVGGHMD